MPGCSVGCPVGLCGSVPALLLPAEGLQLSTQHELLSQPPSPTLGNLCMVTGGANLGRIGVITNRERHPGSFDVVHVKDANGNSFATRLSNIFVIGKVSEGGCGLKPGVVGVACRQLLPTLGAHGAKLQLCSVVLTASG